ncbi:MAG TPA: 3-oxoadipate enol-lactonase [Xanthobacteraceae bacterium]|jgi:3-oxoadipate enol-lactonase|nr:3-oxoadipate enol-lactonase [Xanthobacteraceae bacterium]
MPDVHTKEGFSLNVEDQGPRTAPVLMLSNSLCTDLRMWDDQVADFTKHFRLVRYDRRGHGKSGVPKGPYTVDDFGHDALAIMDALDLKRVNWCGLSMGGMVGQWLGANAPDRIEKLVMSNTHSYYADKTVWDERMKLAQEKGMAFAAGPAMTRWFTKDYIAQHPEKVALVQQMFAETSIEAYLGCCTAIRNMDMRPTHPRIKAPTLVIVGLQDPATPAAAGEEIQKRIPGAKLATIDASHLSNMGQPRVYTDLVLNFIGVK